MMTSRTRRALVLAGSAVALSVALTGCNALNSLIGGADAERDEEGQVTEQAEIDIFALSVGDCMPAGEANGEISEASVVPCSEPHSDEVYFEFELEDGDFPDSDVINTETEAQCIPAFEEFVGIAWEESTLEVYPITPTQATWDQMNDRIVQCVVFDPADDQLTESLADAAR
jgi:hypothetical protein